MSGTEARVVVKLREEVRGQREVRDPSAAGSRGGAPPDDLGQAIADALAFVADLIAEFQDRTAEEAYLGSGRPKRDRDRPRGAGFDGHITIGMRDAASAERLWHELETNDGVERVVFEVGSTPR
ncbi:hypothetical protein ACWEOH_11185 [Agromyces sp. NPDC004153]